MAKISIAPSNFIPLMPVSLVGANVGGKPNFLAVAWFTRVNYQPPMIALALGAGHHTPKGIRENGTFSVCIPGADLVEKTDYCGLVSGKRVDKSEVFRVFYGELGTAPMIDECPLCAECSVAQIIELPSNHLFIGEIKAVHSEERCLTDGKPDSAKIAPFALTMPDNGYWSLGQRFAKAWSVGQGRKKTV